MPNWCENTLKISHKDPSKLDEFVIAWNEGNLLGTLIPCPKELRDTMSGSMGVSEDKHKQYAKEMHEFQMQLNQKYFGYRDWYDWCVANWGTKWDIGYDSARDNKAYITEVNGSEFVMVSFDSAWSPPLAAYEKLVEMGYQIHAYYYEPGMMFCGRYDEDGEQHFPIRGNYKWVRKNVPIDIDDMFRISESMQEMEEMEAE